MAKPSNSGKQAWEPRGLSFTRSLPTPHHRRVLGCGRPLPQGSLERLHTPKSTPKRSSAPFLKPSLIALMLPPCTHTHTQHQQWYKYNPREPAVVIKLPLVFAASLSPVKEGCMQLVTTFWTGNSASLLCPFFQLPQKPEDP